MPTPTSLELAGWLVCLVAVAAGINQVMKLVDRVKDKPAPGDVRHEAAEKFVPKTEFQTFIATNQREHENLFKKIGGVERGAMERLDDKFESMQRSAEDGREKIHKRLNRISIGLATICGRIGAQMPNEEEES